jgi:hypothetical protein
MTRHTLHNGAIRLVRDNVLELPPPPDVPIIIDDPIETEFEHRCEVLFWELTWLVTTVLGALGWALWAAGR